MCERCDNGTIYVPHGDPANPYGVEIKPCPDCSEPIEVSRAKFQAFRQRIKAMRAEQERMKGAEVYG